MAKVKVHELAKELNIQSKEILQYLSEQNIEVKSHMSSIEDDVIRVVKKKFAKSEPVKEEKAAPKAAVKEADGLQERPKKQRCKTTGWSQTGKTAGRPSDASTGGTPAGRKTGTSTGRSSDPRTAGRQTG